ncbi:MAG: pilus assembly protein PilW [Burkholderiaceae bacterium]|nr:pilus assembly protein PilW [Burkholderiaceae bacterium]
MNIRAQSRKQQPVRTCRRDHQRGLTLVELMVSITLGMLVVLASTALLVSSKSTYTSSDDDALVRDTARYAIENITRSVRQAAFENWDTEITNTTGLPQAPIVSMPNMTANLSGLDANTLTGSSSTAGIGDKSTSNVVNGSDVLAVRFFGVGTPDSGTVKVTSDSIKKGYGSVIDCAGFAIQQPTSQDTADADRGWSIYYVAKDANGEPELRCKYRADGASTWSTVAIARGVESFQVLYGVDTNGDRTPNKFLTATEIDELDTHITYTETDTEKKKLEFNRKTNWKKVLVVKIALLVRGAQNVQGDTSAITYNLFGPDYSSANASNDTGTQIKIINLDASVRQRVRKVFEATIQYRNAAEGSGKTTDIL